MSRIVQRKVQITTKDGLPHIIIDGDDTYTVSAILDWWQEAGQWWLGESQRTMYRIETAEHFLFDLQFQDGEWSIYRVWD